MTAPDGVRTGRIESGPFRLSYKIEGKGIPAIVVGSVLYYTRAFSSNLRDHLQLIFMDHRGFAATPGPVSTDEFAIDVLVDDIEKVRAHLDLDKIIIIGHSGHSYMALEYAKKYPEHTSHVVMIGISPKLGEDMLEEAEKN